MKQFTRCILTLMTLGLIAGCQNSSDNKWSQAISKKNPAVIVPSQGMSPSEILSQTYIPFVDDITSSAIQLISEIESSSNENIQLYALTLYPGTGRQLQPIWLIQAPGGYVGQLHKAFFKEFTQNKYQFRDQVIHKLHVKNRVLFASQVGDLLILSESSLGVEDALRSYLGLSPSIELASAEITSPSLIINTSSLDYWVEQLAKVQYRPSIKNAFNGAGPTMLNVETLSSDESNNELRFTGTIPLKESERSVLINALSSENAPITLDQYISSNAAAFGIFRLPPRLVPPGSVQDTTRLDSLFLADNDRYNNLAETLEPEFSLVTYTESGFLSTGEHLFLRKLSNPDAFVNQLNQLVREGIIRKPDDTFVASGTMLANMIGSELCSYTDFYLNVTGDVVVISKRKGLAEIVESDQNRRRVIYYDQSYRDIRNNLPEQVSGYVFTNADLYDFVQPYLDPNTYADAITSQFNQLTMTFQLDQEQQQLAFEMQTYTREESDIPYREQWYFPTGGAKLSGDPVLANLRGSARDEVIFATESGSVYALASDGTTVMQTNTGEDQPIGSPVVYDWYGTNQQVILLAAGNKVYGWNDTGTPLPKFPFEMSERITTPLSITDIDRNGLPEAVVATANRQLHALNGRGNNINGWPVTTNAIMTNKPLVGNFQGRVSVIGFSENAIHGWNMDGSTKADFPIFVNASLVGSPVIHEGNILAGAADGYLYAAGGQSLFADSLNVYSNRADSANIEAVYVSNSSLSGTPSVQTLSVQSGEEIYNEPMILTMSSNGSVFLLSQGGQLRLTKSMGQPAAQNFSPFITDINSDGQQDIISLASFGRLYAWQISDGERIYSLPTSGMQFPIVTDLDRDGNKELIAQTREGLRSWTIYEVEEEAEPSTQN